MNAPSDWRTRLVRMLWITAAILIAASMLTFAIAQLAAGQSQDELWSEVHENLSLGIERNLPSWFATMIWGGFGLAAWYRFTQSSDRRLAWLLMAAVGWGASLDEYVMLHERLGGPTEALERGLGVDLGGATWVLAGGLIALALAGLLGRLVFSLQPPARRDLLVGGALFIVGAIGFEFISVRAVEARGTIDWYVMVTYHLEEALEYVGVILAIRGLLRLGPTSMSRDTGRDAAATH